MKFIYTNEQIRSFDASYIRNDRNRAVKLMEIAASGVVSRLKELCSDDSFQHVAILCGPGNNGGDGFAIAQMLNNPDLISLYSFSDKNKYSFEANYEKELSLNLGYEIQPYTDLYMEDLHDTLIVDSIFGTGLNRAVSEEISKLISYVNDNAAYILSVDIPSGINGNTGNYYNNCIHATETITFQGLKIGNVLEPGRTFCGKVSVHPLSDEEIEGSIINVLEQKDLSVLLPSSNAFDHKGSNGKVCIIAGSKQFPGAAVLCASSAMRSGAGIIYSFCLDSIRQNFSVIPEVIPVQIGNDGQENWDENASSQAIDELKRLTPDAICIGPGLGNCEIQPLLKYIIDSNIPCVLDADCLNFISKRKEFLSELHKNIVLTPHPGEMCRLTGLSKEEICRDPIQKAKETALKWNCNILLKSATSCITDGIKVYINQTGNEGLAKGGSGDILSGIILSLLAFGMTPIDAAACGSYILGLSSEKAYSILGKRMLIGSDVISMIKETANCYSI